MITRSQTGHIRRTARYDPYAYSTDVHDLVEPTCFTQANRCPQWRAAMQDEINAMLCTDTWTFVPNTSSMHVIGCMWIYKLKRDAQGQVTP